MCDTIRQQWMRRLEESLPPETAVTARNHAITSQYARWYLHSPDLLKWAGAAAFASHRVGLALLPYDLIVEDGNAIAIANTIDNSIDELVLLSDLDLVRQTNNLVFADIGWAHLAYLSPDGGIGIIEQASQEGNVAQELLDGFRAIEKGQKLLIDSDADRSTADSYIWQGNSILLRHEQLNTVQKQFDKFQKSFSIFLSIATTMDFDANNLLIDWGTHTSFTKYMWTGGFLTLLLTMSCPDITNFQHRWRWVQKRVFPIWRHVDSTDRTLRRKMKRMLV